MRPSLIMAIGICALFFSVPAHGQTDGVYECRGEGNINPPAWMPPTAPGQLHLSMTTQTINGSPWRTDPKHTERVDFHYALNDRVFSVDLAHLTLHAVNPDGSG